MKLNNTRIAKNHDTLIILLNYKYVDYFTGGKSLR